MKNKHFVIILVTLLISGIIYGCASKSTVKYANCKIYTDKNFNFSFVYPHDWEAIPAKEKIIFLNPDKKYEGKYITLNVQVLSSNDSGGKYKSVESIINDLTNQLKSNKCEINCTKPALLGGLEGKEISLSFTLDKINCTQTQIIARRNKYYYVLTYHAPEKYYKEHIYVYEQAKKSWRWL